MTQEQKDALKVIEKLIDRMHEHTITSEEIMVLIQGIMSNECNSSYPDFSPGLYPNTTPSLTPPFIPRDVWCKDNPKISLYSNECTTTLDELPNHFKGEKEMIEETRKKLVKDEGRTL